MSSNKRQSERETTPFTQELAGFVSEQAWTFAKTMPVWPHEYIVRAQGDERLFEVLVRHIREHGYEGRFYDRSITYFDESGMVYWTMGSPLGETTIVNRCRKEDSYDVRVENGTLPV